MSVLGREVRDGEATSCRDLGGDQQAEAEQGSAVVACGRSATLVNSWLGVTPGRVALLE